ncbi:MAG: hypothetical protein FJ038_10390 [Chloroflexi bacterium]|nr:hypothetical protein [Chloroflexota bacterium]
MTALIGPRGAGKSQLLGAIAWLLAGYPAITRPRNGAVASVSAVVRYGDEWLPIERRTAGVDPPDTARLPACTFFRARDRLVPAAAMHGVGARLASQVGAPTSDAAAADALVSVIHDCCEAGSSGEVLLIEEPELQLIPQAQRYLYRLLRRFAEGGNQVLYSTRSPAFLDAAHHHEIVRLDLHAGRHAIRRTDPATLTDEERLRLAAAFDHERSEMFFAQAVVLVEGQTERLALPFVFSAMGHDPDAEGISIVEVGGKSNLPLAASLLRQLGIPFVVVHDADRDPVDSVTERRIREAAGGAPIVRLVPDFEAAAGLRRHEDKVFQAWRRFSRPGRRHVPAQMARVVEATLAERRPQGREIGRIE